MAAARDVPTSTTVLLPHASSSVRAARRELAESLAESQVASTVADDAILILSELLSNALRHARPLASGEVRVAWRLAPDGILEIEVTDGGGPTRPQQATPSISARGGRGLDIITALAGDWGVRTSPTETTVWAVLAVRARHARRDQDAPDAAALLPDEGAQPPSPAWTGAAGGGRPARRTTRMPSHRATMPHPGRDEAETWPAQADPAAPSEEPDPAADADHADADHADAEDPTAGQPDAVAPLRRSHVLGP